LRNEHTSPLLGKLFRHKEKLIEKINSVFGNEDKLLLNKMINQLYDDLRKNTNEYGVDVISYFQSNQINQNEGILAILRWLGYEIENGWVKKISLGENLDLETPSTRGIKSGEGRVTRKFFDYTLDAHEATEENAYDAARGLDWQEIETSENDYPYLSYVDTVNGVGIWHNYGHDAYYFSDETEESDSWRYIEESILEGKTNKEKIIDMIIQAGLDLANGSISKEVHDRKTKELENVLINMGK
jgi:hypothetical protein